MDLRRFHRITYTPSAVFSCNNLSYEGRLVNISLQGAMVSANEGLMASPGDRCTIAFTPEASPDQLLIYGEVVHAFYSMAGIKFLLSAEEGMQIYRLLEGMTPEPERLKQEWEHILLCQTTDETGAT